MHPVVKIVCRKRGKRRWSIVVGFLARHPKMHWSKLVMPIASRVRRRRMAELVQTLDGSSAFAHVGYWGCSMKAQPPVKAKTSTTSMMNRMSLDPMRTCRHAFNGMLGIPFGQLPDLTGGGLPARVWQLNRTRRGGPPRLHTPVLFWCGPSTKSARMRRLNLPFPSVGTCPLRAQTAGDLGKNMMFQQVMKVTPSAVTWKEVHEDLCADV